MKSPHEKPVEFEKVAAVLRELKLNRAVVAKAQYSPEPSKVERTFVFSEEGDVLKKVTDAWLTPETYKRVLNLLHNVDLKLGSCSAMYRTRPKYIWAFDDIELCLWRNGKLSGRLA